MASTGKDDAPPPFSDATLAKLRAQFASFDLDGNGEISVEEMTTAFELSMSAGKAGEAVTAALQDMDEDKDGAVDFDEFVSAHHRFALRTFRDLDLNGDGTVCNHEMASFLRSHMAPSHASAQQEDPNQFVDAVDANKDGVVSLPEFLSVYDKLLPDTAAGTDRQLANFMLSPEKQSLLTLWTGILNQGPKPGSALSPALGAFCESFYRSALNSMINARLTGVKGALFPNMHIQVPTRVVYITGLKECRRWLAENVNTRAHEYKYPSAVLAASAVAPGIAMLPMSSLLEAANAGHMNPEPLARRWQRGLVPRLARECIFAVGLNNVSEHFEQSIKASGVTTNPFAQNMGGSLLAGVFAGYLSHVPHNLSTLKLMQPDLTYRQHFTEYLDTNMKGSSLKVPAAVQPAFRVATGLLLPRGCLVRTAQICGSFAILNGTIALLDKYKLV